jgi:hypothetical protein
VPATVFELVGLAAIDHFARTGWLLVSTLDDARVAALRSWVDDVASWPDDGDGWMHHREMTEHGPVLCRSENLVPFHAGLRSLLTSGTLPGTAGALLGEPAVLYKEKVNYKLPGGAGYAAHQDAPAYRFVDSHVSCMVAIDDSTVGNGCLEVASGMHHDLLPTDETGCIRADVAATMAWDAVEVRAGQTLWFHSRTPHRSGPNTSARSRRALYPTYNAASEGDLRAAYYADKLAHFVAADEGERVRVSLIGDFQGRPVPARPERASGT